MGLFKRLFGKSPPEQATTTIMMMQQRENSFYSWNGALYRSDIVRACIRPKVKAIGKLVAKHIRETVKDGVTKVEVNPDAYMKFLLEEPNPLMSGQKLQEKLATQLCLNNNAFALIVRNEEDYPTAIYPIDCTNCTAKEVNGEMFLTFTMSQGNGTYTFPYRDVIHLRSDMNDSRIFGESIAPALAELMEVVSHSDQSIMHAIRNSSFIKWLLKYHNALRPELKENAARDFEKSFMSLDNGKSVAVVDASAEIQQVENKDYVPNAAIMKQTEGRIYNLLNTNTAIVQSSFTENEWNSYYEAEVEPVALDLQAEYTRKIFSRRVRSFGNRIVFEAANLQCASISTRLALVALVDRGAMTPNEWRKTFNLAPLEGGDKAIRRLDTATVEK